MPKDESLLNPRVLMRKLQTGWATRILLPLSLTIEPFFEKQALEKARQEQEALYDAPDNPLISVTIATYNRSDLLIKRAIKSVLAQTYQNFEIIVVGDGCTDNTAEEIAKLNDDRIRFYNLPQRGNYPEDKLYRWYVAGSYPLNRALDEAKGLWIAHLDDDDIFEPNHLEFMLQHVYSTNLEFAWGKRMIEISSDDWRVTGDEENIPHSSVIFRRYLRIFKFRPYSWRLRMAVNIHISKRMELSGVRMGFVDHLGFKAPLRPETTKALQHAEDRV